MFKRIDDYYNNIDKEQTWEQINSCTTVGSFIYGAGGIAKVLLAYIQNETCRPLGIMDSNCKKWGDYLENYRIMSLSYGLKLFPDCNLVIATSDLYVDEIYQYVSQSVEVERIFVYIYNEHDFSDIHLKTRIKIDKEFWEKSEIESTCSKSLKYYKENTERVMTVYKMFEDKKSKDIYEKVLRGRSFGKREFFVNAYSSDQYFPEDIIFLNNDEVFVDGGAFIGDTVREFIAKTKRSYKKIFAFEPNENLQNELYNNIKEYENIIVYDKGLYSKETQLSFRIVEEKGSSYFTDEADKSQTVKVDVVALDDIINEEVTFIKLDVEGSELAALKGAEKIICKYTPKLAICLYHSDEDFLNIPEYIESLGLNYKYYLRHHTTNQLETVFYAIKAN